MDDKNKEAAKTRKVGNLLLAICATAGVLLAAVVGVLAVRAYIYTETDWRENQFGQFTYTNTETLMPDTAFSVQVNTDGEIVSSNITQTSAVIKSDKGRDKKPTFVRAFVMMIIYSDNTETYDVTSVYSQYVLDFTPGVNWTKLEDGYYYYNKILRPGGKTSDLFGGGVSLKIDETAYENGHQKPLPDGAEVKILVLADTVQAVTGDSSRWTTEDVYHTTEIATAWSQVTKTISPPLEELTDKQRVAQDTDITITWAYTGGD